MQDALSVRHRITHPKQPDDLEITDQELYLISEGHRWLFNWSCRHSESIPHDANEAADA